MTSQEGDSEAPYDISFSHSDRPSLIDVLADYDDLDSDWSLHRALWSGPENVADVEPEPATLVEPISSQQNTPITLDYLPSDEHATIHSSSHQQKSIIWAMLSALDQAMEDLSYNRLKDQFPLDQHKEPSQSALDRQKRQPIQGDDSDHPPHTSNFQHHYQQHYQQLMRHKRYRLLFLQRFRQALEAQGTS